MAAPLGLSKSLTPRFVRHNFNGLYVQPLEDPTGLCEVEEEKEIGVWAVEEKDLWVVQIGMFPSLRSFLNISLKVYYKM